MSSESVLYQTERCVRIQGQHNNNKMERLNGEIRDREKVMRGLKEEDTPILTGYQIFHNYIRPHEALDGKTPAEACGIKIKGRNTWLTLIQNESHKYGHHAHDTCESRCHQFNCMIRPSRKSELLAR